MAAPLSINQKRYLAQLARRAFHHVLAESDGACTANAESFRREEVVKATGKIGLRCCSQDDYKLVEAHFLNLLGESGKAMAALVRHQGNPRRVAESKLVQACRDAGLQLGYAERICRAQFKCSIAEATEKALWCLVFTIRNRSQRRKVTYEAN